MEGGDRSSTLSGPGFLRGSAWGMKLGKKRKRAGTERSRREEKRRGEK